MNSTVVALVSDFLNYKLDGYPQVISKDVMETLEHENVKRIAKSLRRVGDCVSLEFKEKWSNLHKELDVDVQNLKCVIESVANELFCDGISWSKIVTFFVFGGELAVYSKRRSMLHLIQSTIFLTSSYITERLLLWINEHGNWEGLVAYAEGVDSAKNNSRQLCSKNLLLLGLVPVCAFMGFAALKR